MNGTWHFNFRWRGETYRFSLERLLGRRITSRSEAEAEAEKIRAGIRVGTFQQTPSPPQPAYTPPALTFRQLADLWTSRYGYQLASARNDSYRLKQITAFSLTAYNPPCGTG